MPGGCNFGGVRPIDQHVKGFSALGAGVTTEGGYINAIVGRTPPKLQPPGMATSARPKRPSRAPMR